ncbi:MAG: hypothetical protein ABJG78_07365 [Cyclobacteriaceae bacterium]
MTKTDQFDTEHFKFAEGELQLLRGRFPYRKVDFKDVTKLAIIRGIRVNRKWLVLAFGLTLTISSLYVALFTSGFLEAMLNSNFEGGSGLAIRAFGLPMLMIVFLVATGGLAIYQATVPTWILRTEFRDGSTHVFNLNKLFKTNEVSKLAQFLRANFSTNQLIIDNRIV